MDRRSAGILVPWRRRRPVHIGHRAKIDASRHPIRDERIPFAQCRCGRDKEAMHRRVRRRNFCVNSCRRRRSTAYSGFSVRASEQCDVPSGAGADIRRHPACPLRVPRGFPTSPACRRKRSPGPLDHDKRVIEEVLPMRQTCTRHASTRKVAGCRDASRAAARARIGSITPRPREQDCSRRRTATQTPSHSAPDAVARLPGRCEASCHVAPLRRSRFPHEEKAS